MNTHTYNLRAKILHNYFEVVDTDDGKVMDCFDNAAITVKKVFAACPSFTEIAQCLHGCPERTKTFVTHSIEKSVLIQSEMDDENIIKDYIQFCQNTPCIHKKCKGKEQTNHIIGKENNISISYSLNHLHNSNSNLSIIQISADCRFSCNFKFFTIQKE